MADEAHFSFLIEDIAQESSHRIRVFGTVQGDTLYKTDGLALESDPTVTACVQTIRVDRKKVNDAEPGSYAALTLPGIKKNALHVGDTLCRAELADRDSATAELVFPVNPMLLSKAAKNCLRLSPEHKILFPLFLLFLCLALVLIRFTAASTLLPMKHMRPPWFRMAADLAYALLSVALATAGFIGCRRMMRLSATRRSCYGKMPLQLTAEDIVLEYKIGSYTIKSEVAFSDIDAVFYYPRYGLIRVCAPVNLTKYKDGHVVGTKQEATPEKAFQIYYLVYMENDDFLRALSARSGVPIETVSLERPDIDGAAF